MAKTRTPITDRLTQLPDSLRLQIISRLSLPDAVRTALLSSAWKHLWKHAHQITLHYPRDPLRGNVRRFYRALDFFGKALPTLTQSIACANITEFSLIIEDPFCGYPVVDKLFRWAFSRNVKALTWSSSGLNVALEGFCHSSSLETLTLRSHKLIKFLPPVVSWTSLKNFHLSCLGISDVSIAKVLSGCPVLQTLVLHCIRIYTSRDFVVLNIDSPSVKTLWVDGLVKTTSNHGMYYVNAPWLEYLYYVGVPSGDALVLKNASSMLKSNLDLMHNSVESMGYDAGLYLKCGIVLLKSLCHVENLVLGTYFINVLPFVTRSIPCPLLKCKHLTIYVHAGYHEFPATMNLFQRSPFVESLFINMEHDDKIVYGLTHIWYADDAFGGFSTAKVAFQCLKYLQISHTFRYPISHQGVNWNMMERYFKLAACIMRNAPFLKEVVIALLEKPKYYYSTASSSKTASDYFSLLSQKFLDFIGEWFNYDHGWEMTVKMSSFQIICRRDST